MPACTVLSLDPLEETATDDPVPRMNLGVGSCVLFLLPLLAVVGILLLDGAWGPLFDDPRPNDPEPPGLVVLVASFLFIVVLALPLFLLVGVAWALCALFDGEHRRWTALLGLGLHGSVILWWFFKWPIPWM